MSGTDNAGKQGAKFRAREKIFYANETKPTQRGCVYCDATDHKAVNFNKFVTAGDRRKQLGLKQLCFNCTGSANAVLAARSAGNRLRRVQRETNQEFRRLVRDEPALESLGNHPPLPNNHIESLKRLKNLVRKLEMQGELERYNDISQTKLSQGIV